MTRKAQPFQYNVPEIAEILLMELPRNHRFLDGFADALRAKCADPLLSGMTEGALISALEAFVEDWKVKPDPQDFARMVAA